MVSVKFPKTVKSQRGVLFFQCIIIICLLSAAIYGQPFEMHTIGENLNGASILKAADMDGDNDKDIVVAAVHADRIVWYEAPDWTAETVVQGWNGASYFQIADMDGDNDNDIIASAWEDDILAWFENPDWTKHTIDESLDGPSGICVVDINGDDTLDVAVAGWYANQLVWYEGPDWIIHTIDSAVFGPTSILNPDNLYVLDVDADNDLDVICTSTNNDYYVGSIIMYEGPDWTKQIIDESTSFVGNIIFSDLDKDTLLEAAATGYRTDKVYLYELPGWTRSTIDPDLNSAAGLDIGDLNNDGWLDIIAAGQVTTDPLRCYKGPYWTKESIYKPQAGVHSVYITDLDDDNDLDIAASIILDDKVVWFENKLPKKVPGHYATIQAAIDAAKDGDVVLVDEGTYYENINFKGKAITVASHFYLDGDTTHRDNTIIDGSQPTNPDSGSVVYFISGEDTTSVLMGFTITNGTGTKHQYTYEGVKYDSRDGGGIYCWNSGGRFVSNKIINNTISCDTEAFGGGLAAGDFRSDAWVILKNNLISNNTVNGIDGAFAGGAGLTCNGKLLGNTISYNSCYATENEAEGGGVYIGTEPTFLLTVFIEDNHITRNFVQGKGISAKNYWSVQGGGIINLRTKIFILNNEISYNQLKSFNTGKASGGGIYMFRAAYGSVISGNTISYNKNEVSGTRYGGGIGLGTGNGLSITNNIISGNSASHGGGIRLRDNDASIINNTIVNNTASAYGGGLHAADSYPVIINTIFWGNDAAQNAGIYPSTFTKVRYSDVQGGYSGTGNIDADPLFSDTLTFELSESSPCIGAGTDSVQIADTWYTCPSVDYAGNARPYPMDSNPDMGAMESELATDIDEPERSMPERYALFQNYPNPFNPITTIEYQIPLSGGVRGGFPFVQLEIFNILGQKVVTLVSEKQQPGKYKVEWDASGFASGIYLYRLETDNGFINTRKLVLLK